MHGQDAERKKAVLMRRTSPPGERLALSSRNGWHLFPVTFVMADQPSSTITTKTLFVRNLPFTTTNAKLETAFEDYGPIKSCFVVKDPGK